MEKQKSVLTGEDCMQVVRDLARSQGSYCNLAEIPLIFSEWDE